MNEPVTNGPKKCTPFLRRTYLPLAVTIAGLVVLFFCIPSRLVGLSASGAILFLAGTLYFFVQAVGRFILRQWWPGIFAFGRFAVCVTALIPITFVILMMGLLGPAKDGFATGLIIPPEVDIAPPLEATAKDGTAEDVFQKAILAALAKPPNSDSSITSSLPSLRLLNEKNRPLLLRFLSANPAWRVFEENGNLFATRRWKINNRWEWNLNGYYSTHDLGDSADSAMPHFQSRVTIGLNGKTWVRDPQHASRMDEGTDEKAVRLTKGNGTDQSHCVIQCGGIVVEIFEQSSGAERRLTKASLKMLEEEFHALAAKNEWSGDLLPANSIKVGTPTIELFNGMQPGIYNIEGWLNPGEAGVVYLRAYEITRKTRLSEGRLYDSSNEQVGWSNKPEELFLYNTEITIYEGDWGQPYAARFELWFKPASGAAERKVLERNFKIEGWQR